MVLHELVIWIVILSCTKACREIRLLTVEENDQGTVLTVVKERDVVGSVTVAQLQLNDRLSPECGSDFRHCQDLLVLTKDESPGSRSALLFVPLNKALGIVEVKKDEYTGSVGFSQTIVLRPSEVYCSPSAFFIITGAVFAICTNRSTNRVYVLDIILDKQDLNQTRYTYSNNINLSEGDLNNRTNFLQVNHLDYYFVIFGLGRAIYSIRPLFFIHSRLNDIPSDFCDILSWLSPKYGDEFWAYCSNNVIDYGIGVEDWKEAFTLEEKGISFWCSQQRINISVFSSYINVTRQDGQKHTISKMGQKFKSGVCTGNKDMSVFVYVDGVTGTHSLDLTSFETRSIFANSCEDSYSCRAPLVTDDKYLMVRGVPETVLVLDSTNISRKIMEAKGISAPMVTLLTFPCPQKPPSVPRDIGLQKSAPLSKMAMVMVGVAGFFVMLVVVVVATAVVVVCVWKQYKRRNNTGPVQPKPEENFKIERDDKVFPLPFKLHSADPQAEPPVDVQNVAVSSLIHEEQEPEDQQPEEEPPSVESEFSSEYAHLIKTVKDGMATSQV